MSSEENTSYFPIVIKYSSSGSVKLIKSPEEIESDQGFRVLVCNAEGER